MMPTDESDRAGKLIMQQKGAGGYRCFIPKPLPPNPPLHFDGEMEKLEEKASLALGRLNGVTEMLPNPDLFLDSYVRKEAVLSSQIEGTQATLEDLFEYEVIKGGGIKLRDIEEVANYVRAINWGVRNLTKLPISLRMMRELHRILLSGVRGGEKNPGEFRRSQNWIGGTKPSDAFFVPPPPHEVLPCMGALENFIHSRKIPTLIKAGLVHPQFESIHPFLDGNGRVGRLLIVLMLCSDQVLRRPLLYLSLFFKTHRQEYYDHLSAIRRSGDWEGWLKFYLRGIGEMAGDATDSAKKIVALQNRHREHIAILGRAAERAEKLLDLFYQKPILTVQVAAKHLDYSAPVIHAAFDDLQKLGLVKEMTGKRRDRVYAYELYIRILRKETEAI